ncbi:MAG: outer membrane lipoprotein carrier protein LolA [Alphaproteobacteria bacterium]|nr:MAG: outer membrane lipoprotein carrier protein LolA [Alphaproteobacteria bacterium]
MKKLLSLCFILISTSAHAHDAAVVMRAQNYLNAMNSLKARFLQVAPDGSIAHGTLYLRKPGKMRWDYDDPNPITMVSKTGKVLYYYDAELEEMSELPIDDSLASFLVQKTISFNDPRLEMLHANAKDGVEIVRVRHKEQPDEGELAFEFTTSPYALQNIVLKDAKGEETGISLDQAQQNIPLKESLFELRDPHRLRRGR